MWTPPHAGREPACCPATRRLCGLALRVNRSSALPLNGKRLLDNPEQLTMKRPLLTGRPLHELSVQVIRHPQRQLFHCLPHWLMAYCRHYTVIMAGVKRNVQRRESDRSRCKEDSARVFNDAE